MLTTHLPGLPADRAKVPPNCESRWSPTMRHRPASRHLRDRRRRMVASNVRGGASVVRLREASVSRLGARVHERRAVRKGGSWAGTGSPIVQFCASVPTEPEGLCQSGTLARGSVGYGDIGERTDARKARVGRRVLLSRPRSLPSSAPLAIDVPYSYTPSSHALSAASRAAASTPSTNRCALIPTTLPKWLRPKKRYRPSAVRTPRNSGVE